MSELVEINNLLTAALTEEASGQLGREPRERMLRNIRARLHTAAPEGTYTIPARDDWEFFAPGIDRRVLIKDKEQEIETALYRLAPGAKFASHLHTHQETCWVVQGDILVGDSHVVYAGEMHVAEAGSVHREIVARTEALLLIRSQVEIVRLSAL